MRKIFTSRKISFFVRLIFAKLLNPFWWIAQTKLCLSPKYHVTKTSFWFKIFAVFSIVIGFGSTKSKYSGYLFSISFLTESLSDLAFDISFLIFSWVEEDPPAWEIFKSNSFKELIFLWRSCSLLASSANLLSLKLVLAVLCANAFWTELPLAKSANKKASLTRFFSEFLSSFASANNRLI